MSSKNKDSSSRESSKEKESSKINTTKQLPSDRSENEGDRSSVIEAEKKRLQGAKGKKQGAVEPLDFAKGSRDVAVRGYQKSMQQMREVNRDLDEIENMGIMKRDYSRPQSKLKNAVNLSDLTAKAAQDMLKRGLQQAAINLAINQGREQKNQSTVYQDQMSRAFANKLQTMQLPSKSFGQQNLQTLVMKHEGIQTDGEPSRTAMMNRHKSTAGQQPAQQSLIPKLKIPIIQQVQKPPMIEKKQDKVLAADQQPKKIASYRQPFQRPQSSTQKAPLGRFSNSVSNSFQRPPITTYQRPTYQQQLLPLSLQDFYRGSSNNSVQRTTQMSGGYMQNGFNQNSLDQFYQLSLQQHLAIQTKPKLPLMYPIQNKLQTIQQSSFNEGTGRFGPPPLKIQNVNQAIGLLMNA